MDSSMNYLLYWAAYLLATLVFYVIFWKITKTGRPVLFSYLLRGLMLALIITPWYSNSQNEQFAPALMVVTLDAITIGPSEAIGALVLLILSLILAFIVSLILYFKNRIKYK